MNDTNSNAAAATAAVPRQSGKVGSAELADLPVLPFDSAAPVMPDAPARLQEIRDGFVYDYLWSPRPGARRLFVLFSGDAQRSRFTLPVFQRWSWAPHFPGHCLYVSDPSLHLDDKMGLAWYAGTSAHDPLRYLIQTLDAILPQLGLTREDVFSYGSSGGGFAALRLAALMEGIGVVAINPQTEITAYEPRSVERYIRTCLDSHTRETALRKFPERLRLAEHVEALRQRRIIYAQNVQDTHHMEAHMAPFCAAMGESTAENRDHGLFRRMYYDDPRGHRGAESGEVFAQMMAVIESGFADAD